MTTLVFDVETNGFLDELDTVHSLVIKDVETGEVHSFYGGSIESGLELLAVADTIIGHNIIKFDIPAIQKVYPWFEPKGTIRDTLVLARVLWPDIRQGDYQRADKGKMPRDMIGKHSLEAYGHRLGEHKGEFKGPWDEWTQEMQDYCEQDVEVTTKLWNRLQKVLAKQKNHDFVQLEHDVAEIVARQERRGFAFDREKAVALYSDLSKRRMELEMELHKTFKPWFRPRALFTPKRDNKRMGYVSGCPLTKVELTEFNPGSRDHVAECLRRLRGWKPTEYTNDGKPKVDETILSGLPYPEAQLLAEYYIVQKRLGTLAEGDEALLRHERDGRIHGGVNTNGAVTGRMTHSKPNLNIPRNTAPYGKQMRELFIAGPGMKLVGADADALEDCMLGHYLARHDNGVYAKAVIEGDKTKGTDSHSLTTRAIGLDPKAKYTHDGKERTGRDIGKTFKYALIYGGGNWKLGFILGVRAAKNKIVAAGKKAREAIMRNVTGFKELVETIHDKVRKDGKITGLDGRPLPIRSLHSALNTLLQSAGAVIMKRALVILDQSLMEHGFLPGVDYEFVANVHDEWQIECRPGLADMVGKAATAAIVQAGEYYRLRCPLKAEFGVGNNWSETH